MQDANRENPQKMVRELQEQVETLQMELDYIREIAGKNSQKVKQLSEFVHSITHDLRSPLQSVTGFARSIRNENLTPGEIDEYLGYIETASRRASDLIDHLGSLALKGEIIFKEVININKILSNLPILVSQSSGVRLIPLYGDKTVPIEVDEVRIFEVLQNLIENSMKFRKSSGEQHIIIVGYQERADGFLFSVKDNGQGISTDKLELVFQLGYSGGGRGTGRGLALCREIVKAHGGKIWAESAGEGKGSTFFFTIPK